MARKYLWCGILLVIVGFLGLFTGAYWGAELLQAASISALITSWYFLEVWDMYRTGVLK